MAEKKIVSIVITADGKQAVAEFEDVAQAMDESLLRSARQAKQSLEFLKADLAGRGIAFIVGELNQLREEAQRAAAVDVEQVVANISTIADIDTSKVNRALFDLSTRVPQSAQKLGEGLYNIFSSVSATQEQALKLLEQYSKGAVAASTDTQTFGAAVTGVLNAYKMEFSKAGHVSDVFFNTVNKGVVTGQELAANLGLVTQSAKNAGVSFDELGALIAGVTKEGGPAAQNINNLANLLMKLPTKEASDELGKMQIQLTDAQGNFRPILDVLTELKTKLDQLSPSARAIKLQELFPDLQARTGLMTILSQLNFVKNATLENARAVGVTDEAYKKMSGTAQSKFALLYNSVIAFLAALAEWITKSTILGTIMGWLGGVLQTLSRHTGIVLTLVAALGLLTAAYNAASMAAGISGAMRKGTMTQESSGNVNVPDNIRTGASGLFQVLPENVAPWTKKYVGKTLSVQQLKKDVEAQIKVFNGEMGAYLKDALNKAKGDVKTAIRMAAAAAWYGGKGKMMRFDDPTVFRKGEPSYREYTSSVLERTLRAAGGKVDNIQIFNDEARVLNDIAETRARINKLINEGGGDANQNQLDTLRDFENNLKQIQSVVEDINRMNVQGHLVIGLPDNPAQAQKVLERLNLVKTTLTNLRSQAESTAEQIFNLSSASDSGTTEIEKFDYQLNVLRASGKLTAEDFALLGDDIENVRGNLIKISQLEYAKKLREDAKSVTKAFAQMSASFKYELIDKAWRDKSPLNDFLKQAEGIKELQIAPGKLIAGKSLFSVGENIDVEQLAAYIRSWLEFLAALEMLDESKIDEVVKKVKEAAQGFNDVTEATKNANFDAFKKSLEEQYDEVRRNGRELTVYEETLKKVEGDYKNLDPAQKENLLNLAAEIDAVKELNKQHAELKDFFKETLKYVFEGDFKGLLKSFGDRIKKGFIDKLSDWLATSVLGFDPKSTNNPVAKPIVEKISRSNQLLEVIAANTGGANFAGMPSPFGGTIGADLKSRFPAIFGGFGGGGGFTIEKIVGDPAVGDIVWTA